MGAEETGQWDGQSGQHIPAGQRRAEGAGAAAGRTLAKRQEPPASRPALAPTGHEIPAPAAAKGKVPEACPGARTASGFQCTLVVPDLGLCLCREGT